MTLNLGDFPTGATVYVPFHTFDSNDPSASVTITGLAVTDIEIYKGGSVTQRSSDAGYTLLDTDGIDFDGITGLHGFSVDLSDNTDAGFYAAGGEYWIAVSSITVDAATVNFWAAVFSIERAGGAATILTDTEAVLVDTEAATAVLTDTEAILADSEAILTDTEAATGVITDTEAILTDTEAAITERSTLLTDTEAVLVDTEAAIPVLTDTEAILVDTEAAVNLTANAVWDEAMVETTGAPAVTGTFRAALEWMFGLSRNKITQTATTTTLRNDADSGDLATSTVSDDATTYTRGEWST